MPLVRRGESVLVVVDAQPGFVADEATLERIAWLTRLASLLDIPVVATEEQPDSEGATHPRIARFLPGPPIAKKTFALTGCPEAVAAIDATHRATVVLVGFETDVCVAQSAVTLRDAGWRVVVPEDAVYSARDDQHREGLARMRDADIELHSVKSVTFEWFEDVDTAAEMHDRLRADFATVPWRL
jgi:nicotinamidase-related amidase